MITEINILGKDALAELRQPYAVKRGIYFLWAGDEIVYIGQSVNIHARVAAHFGNPWAKWGLTGHSFIEVAQLEMNPIEAAYILQYRPIRNRAGLTCAFNTTKQPE